MTEQTTRNIDGLDILADSICDLAATRDTNSEGILKTDGTNRGLSCGLTPDGNPAMWMTTNGYDLMIGDGMDQEAWLAVCIDMSDNGADPLQGQGRIYAARDEMLGVLGVLGIAEYDLPAPLEV